MSCHQLSIPVLFLLASSPSLPTPVHSRDQAVRLPPTATHSPLPQDATPPSKNAMSGVWKIKSATLQGQSFSTAVTDTITLTMEGDKYVVDVANMPDKGTCVVDFAKSPHQMTIHGTDGPNKGKTFLAICDFPDESTMRVCYDLSGKAFPTAFESTVENKYYLVIYQKHRD